MCVPLRLLIQSPGLRIQLQMNMFKEFEKLAFSGLRKNLGAYLCFIYFIVLYACTVYWCFKGAQV
jgi:hypothetical protein